jgi:rhodanese-related sulfurtransferase
MKTFKDYISEANAVVPRVAPAEAIAIHKQGQAVFIDVRDTKSLDETGTIEGAHHVPRGMIELAADPDTPFYRDFFQKDAQICIVCGGGVMAALTGKTLLDMGYSNVTNVGGMNDWKEAGGPVDGGWETPQVT